MYAFRLVPPCEDRRADALVSALGPAVVCLFRHPDGLLPRFQDTVAVACYPEKGTTVPGIRAHCPTPEKQPAEIPVLDAAQRTPDSILDGNLDLTTFAPEGISLMAQGTATCYRQEREASYSCSCLRRA
jgi:hypothetical protein